VCSFRRRAASLGLVLVRWLINPDLFIFASKKTGSRFKVGTCGLFDRFCRYAELSWRGIATVQDHAILGFVLWRRCRQCRAGLAATLFEVFGRSFDLKVFRGCWMCVCVKLVGLLGVASRSGERIQAMIGMVICLISTGTEIAPCKLFGV